MEAVRFPTLHDLEAAQSDGVVPGYALSPDEWGDLELWVVLPTGAQTRLFLDDRAPWSKRWRAVEHEDGTVSVSPSVKTRSGGSWYLRRGRYEKCAG